MIRARFRALAPLLLIPLAVLLPAVPLLAISQSDPAFRDCMRQVWDRREDALIDANRAFYDATISALQDRRNQYDDAWSIEDSRARSTAFSNADKTYRDRVRAARDAFNTADRTIRNIARDDERNCRNLPSSPPPPGTCDALRQHFDQVISQIRNCSADADCKIFQKSCPLVTCGVAVNRSYLRRADDAAGRVESCLRDSGAVPCAICNDVRAVCSGGRCTEIP